MPERPVNPRAKTLAQRTVKVTAAELDALGRLITEVRAQSSPSVGTVSWKVLSAAERVHRDITDRMGRA